MKNLIFPLIILLIMAGCNNNTDMTQGEIAPDSSAPVNTFEASSTYEPGESSIPTQTSEPPVKENIEEPTENVEVQINNVPSIDTAAQITPPPIPNPVEVSNLTLSEANKLDNTKYGWGFLNVPEKTESLLLKYNSMYRDRTKSKVLYLTFDQGYENGYTPKILDALKNTNTPAAFFITGGYFKTSSDLIQRMLDEGHIVGNHSENHPSMPSVMDEDKFKKELTTLEDSYKEKFGQNMKYFRPPMGEYSERSLAMTNALGYRSVFWSFAYVDWDVNNQKGTEFAYDKIMNGVYDGCILLLHSVSKDNAEVLEKVIIDLKAKGYTFKSLDDIE